MKADCFLFLFNPEFHMFFINRAELTVTNRISTLQVYKYCLLLNNLRFVALPFIKFYAIFVL